MGMLKEIENEELIDSYMAITEFMLFLEKEEKEQ